MKKITIVLYLLVVGIVIGLSCKKTQTNNLDCDIEEVYKANKNKETITQGICGTVSFKEGNCFPADGNLKLPCPECPVKREVRIYEQTTLQNAEPQANPAAHFYTAFSTPLLKTVVTDDEGFYQVELPAGTYTIVVVEDGKLYVFSQHDNGISLAKIENGKLRHNLVIDYKAIY